MSILRDSKMLTITSGWQSLWNLFHLVFPPRAWRCYTSAYASCTNKHHCRQWTTPASRQTWWNIRWSSGMQPSIPIGIQWQVAPSWNPAGRSTLEHQIGKKVDHKKCIWLTILCFSIILLVPVEAVRDRNNEGDKTPNQYNHELRNIF